MVDRDTEMVQLFGREQPLHAFEQFALFAAYVGGEKRGEGSEVVAVHLAGGGAVDGVAQLDVIFTEAAYQSTQLRMVLGGGEEHTLLGVKVKTDLLVEEADDLTLPLGDVVGAAATFDSDAESKSVLVLAGQRV